MERPEEKCAACTHRRGHHQDDQHCYFILKDAKGQDAGNCTCRKFVPSGKV